VTVGCGDGSLGWTEHHCHRWSVGHSPRVGHPARLRRSAGDAAGPARPAALDRLAASR
jgi:hypothetical protein